MGNEVTTNGRHDGGWMELVNRMMTDPSFDMSKIDALERILAMHERQLMLQATEDAADAMAKLQAELEPVKPTKPNTQFANKRYATVADVWNEIKPLYTKYGFSISFSEESDPRPDWIHYSATVMRGRWTRTVSLFTKREQAIKGARTQIQEAGGISTYMRRYLMGMAFNIITAEDARADSDGTKPTTDDVKKFLDKLSEDCKAVKTVEAQDVLLKDGKLLRRLDTLRQDYPADWKTAQEIINGMRARLEPHIIDQNPAQADKPAGEHLI